MLLIDTPLSFITNTFIMDRRTTLAKMLGRKAKKTTSDAAQPLATMVASGLDPYTGPFEFEQAAHLLRRTMSGPTYQQIKDAVGNGLDQTLQTLLADNPLPDEPVNHNLATDPNVAIGDSWVDQAYVAGDLGQEIRVNRNNSLTGWTVDVWRNAGVTIREKMTLFWHNHFVTAETNDPNFTYRYITLLRKNALGNFRELTKEVTVDPAMLLYLNGHDNTALAPNENYARELLELFTIGKGPQVGPGDYTNYTEDDVVEMARVLTGWVATGQFTQDPVVNPPGSLFRNQRHDDGTKQLSHRFDNIVIEDLGETEYAHLIDIIFTKDECARFIARKLYRWFVYYVISAEVEADVIEPMAQLIIDNDYEIKPAVEALLSSEHFFDILSVGPMIKNPIDFITSIFNTFEIEISPDNLDEYYRLQARIVRTPLQQMQMVMYAPPSVAGWSAYYQEPTYYRTWISASTLPPRMNFTNVIANNGANINQTRAQIDVLKFTASIDDPFDPNSLIDEFSKILYPQPIDQGQKDILKSILIPGLPDFEWTVEYGDHINNPDDDNLKAAVESKLKNLLTAMMSMPEYYLS